jgi:hypothetical protein
MPVNQPESGDLITKASVLDMYDAVRALTNAQSPSTVTRGTFREEHLPSIVRQAQFLNVITNFVVPPVIPFAELPTLWTTLTPYTLDNAGAGFTVGAGYLLMYASLRWQDIIPVGAGNCDQALWLNFNFTLNGTLFQQTLNNRFAQMTRYAAASPNRGTEIVEETITWWHLVDCRSLSPTFNLKMGVKGNVAAMNTLGVVHSCNVPNGTIGFISLYGG